MFEDEQFTGFGFIDEKLGGLLPDKLCCIGGIDDPIAAEQLTLSLLKGIVDHNPDKFVVLINCKNFVLLHCTVFAFYGENAPYGEMVRELSQRLPLQQIREVRTEFTPSLEKLRKEILHVLNGRPVAAIVMADGFNNSTKLKLIAKEFKTPVIVYDCGYQDEDFEELSARHPAADILIRYKANKEGESSELICNICSSKKTVTLKTNEKNGLQETIDLPADKNKLWFYE